MGVCGGSYFGEKINEYPKSWFKKAKLSKTFDIEKNRFKVKAGLTRKEWLDKGWILKKILLVGFSGIVDLQMEGEFPTLIKFKLKDGKLLKDM